MSRQEGNTGEELHRTVEDPKSAMTEILQSHGARLLAAARRLLSDEDEARDAFQEGLLAAWRSLGSFQGRSSLSTWVHRIVVNHALERLRKMRRVEEHSIEELLPTFTDYGHHCMVPEVWVDEPGSALERTELRNLVTKSIARLPEAYRVPLLLYEIEGMEIAEIAKSLCTTANAVRIRVHRARQALKSLLEPHVTTATS